MKVVFCGTPQFAVPTLRALVDAGHEIVLVVTQPERASGRGLVSAQPAVQVTASAMGLTVEQILQPEKIKNNAEFRARLESIGPDAIVVVAYGRIIPKWMLGLPKYGNINLHGSLLPKYRGAAPVQWAIAHGESESGVTTMLLNEGLDTGDILLAHKVAISPDTTAPEMFETLAEVGAELMIETLRKLENGEVDAVAQDHSAATAAPLLTRADGEIDFSRTARQIYDRWRGFMPWPGAFTRFRGKRLAILAPAVHGGGEGNLARGALVVSEGKLLVGCGGQTTLELREVQVEGKTRVTADEFVHAYQVRDKEPLG